MGKMSREKGKRFERRIADDLRRLWPTATVRRSLQAHRAYEPDVVVEGAAPELARRLWLELTHGRAPQPLEKLAQAERDIRSTTLFPWRIPVAVWHRHGTRTVNATLRLDALNAIARSDAVEHDFHGVPVTVDWAQLVAILRQEAA